MRRDHQSALRSRALGLIIGLSLLGCGGEPIPGATEAALFCATYCDACGTSGCESSCLDQWHLFGGHEDPDKRECADELLIGYECLATRGCDNVLECGDPLAAYRDCVQRID